MSKLNQSKYFLYIIVLFLGSCQEKAPEVLSPAVENLPMNRSINSDLVFIKQNKVGQLIISQVKDDYHSNIYILNEPESIPFTENSFNGMVLSEDGNLTVIDFSSDQTVLFITNVKNSKTNNIRVNGLGLYSSDLPANLDFILPDKSFYQSAYLYYTNKNNLEIDPEFLNSLEHKASS